MAQEWRRQLDAREIETQAEIARREGVSRARVTQVMGLLRLLPVIQEYVLSLQEVAGRSPITERTLRPISQLESRDEQRSAFSTLLDSQFPT
ncbi:MAG: hypothetical protein C0404_10245 [Verrucomicrobia bacterium]|nr:hypothetical protein [Verrucomicrobiota bacterium]